MGDWSPLSFPSLLLSAVVFPLRLGFSGIIIYISSPIPPKAKELELELIQTQTAQKPMPRAEVYARALRASQIVKEGVCMGGRAMRQMSGRGVGKCGSGRHSYGVA